MLEKTKTSNCNNEKVEEKLKIQTSAFQDFQEQNVRKQIKLSEYDANGATGLQGGGIAVADGSLFVDKTAILSGKTGNYEDCEEDLSDDIKQIQKRKKAVAYMIKIAMFAGLSVILMLFDFPIFPLIPYIKMDFASVPSLLGGFVLGPIAAVLIEFFKILSNMLITGSYSMYIGELSNFICAVAFVLPPAILYKYKKGFKFVIVGLVCGVLSQLLISTLSNIFLIFPMYISAMGTGFLQGESVIYVITTGVMPLNIIKTTATATIVFLIYKQVGKLLGKISF